MTTRAQRYNARMDKIFETAKRLKRLREVSPDDPRNRNSEGSGGSATFQHSAQGAAGPLSASASSASSPLLAVEVGLSGEIGLSEVSERLRQLGLVPRWEWWTDWLSTSERWTGAGAMLMDMLLHGDCVGSYPQGV